MSSRKTLLTSSSVPSPALFQFLRQATTLAVFSLSFPSSRKHEVIIPPKNIIVIGLKFGETECYVWQNKNFEFLLVKSYRWDFKADHESVDSY
jgi:hypothetical protein